MKSGPLIVGRGQGVRIRDHQGREMIDCGAGLWCVNIGYGRPEIAEAARAAIENLNYYHIFGGSSNEPIIRLADRVLTLLRENAGARHLARVFFGCSGSDANDTNVKLVRYYNNLLGRPQKKKIIAREGGYHGLTCAAGSLTGIPVYHKAFDLPLEGVVHTSCPHWYRFAEAGESEAAFCDRMIAELEALIEREGPETIAAFIAEPIMGTGGVLLPPEGYFARVQEILEPARHPVHRRRGDHRLRPHRRMVRDRPLRPRARHRDARQGHHQRLLPAVRLGDLASGSGTCSSRPRREYGPVMHGFTYSGHPVGGAIGLANLDIMESEGLVDNAARVGPYLLERLRATIGDHPYVGDVRGEGLVIAVEFIADRATRRPFAAGTNPHRIGQRQGARARPDGAAAALHRGDPVLAAACASPRPTATRRSTASPARSMPRPRSSTGSPAPAEFG